MRISTSPPRRSPTRHARALWSVAAMLAAMLAPAAALAGKKEDAKAHIARATRAHKEARYADARAELEAAYQLDPRPELLYAIGQVDAKLGNCDEAVDHYRRFAATQTDPQVAKVVDEAIAACPSPAAPAAAAARPEGDAEDPPASRKEPAAPRSSPPSARGTSATRAQEAPAVAEQRPAWYEDKLADGLIAGGVVATIIGLVEYRNALSDVDAAGDRATTTNVDRFHELVDSAHGERTASIVFLGAGSALIAAGIVRYVLHDRAGESRGVGVAAARGGGVVTYGGRF